MYTYHDKSDVQTNLFRIDAGHVKFVQFSYLIRKQTNIRKSIEKKKKNYAQPN